MNETQRKEYRERFKRGFAITICLGAYKPQLVLTKMHFRLALWLFAITIYFYDFEARIMLKLSNK